MWLDMDGDEQGEERNLYHLLLLLLLSVSVGIMRDRMFWKYRLCQGMDDDEARQRRRGAASTISAAKSSGRSTLENLPGRDPRGDYKADWPLPRSSFLRLAAALPGPPAMAPSLRIGSHMGSHPLPLQSVIQGQTFFRVGSVGSLQN